MEPKSLDSATPATTLRDLFVSLFQYRRSVLAFVFVVTASVIVISLLMQPVYRGEVLVAPQTSDAAAGGLARLASQFGGLASLAGMSASGERNADESIVTSQRAVGY